MFTQKRGFLPKVWLLRFRRDLHAVSVFPLKNFGPGMLLFTSPSDIRQVEHCGLECVIQKLTESSRVSLWPQKRSKQKHMWKTPPQASFCCGNQGYLIATGLRRKNHQLLYKCLILWWWWQKIEMAEWNKPGIKWKLMSLQHPIIQ